MSPYIYLFGGLTIVYDPSAVPSVLSFFFSNCDRYVSISRSFFSHSFGHGGDIGSGVECWRGYYQSLRATQMGLSLNIGIVVANSFALLNHTYHTIYSPRHLLGMQ